MFYPVKKQQIKTEQYLCHTQQAPAQQCTDLAPK